MNPDELMSGFLADPDPNAVAEWQRVQDERNAEMERRAEQFEKAISRFATDVAVMFTTKRDELLDLLPVGAYLCEHPPEQHHGPPNGDFRMRVRMHTIYDPAGCPFQGQRTIYGPKEE